MDEPSRELPRKRRFGRRSRGKSGGQSGAKNGGDEVEVRSLKPLRIVYAAVAHYPAYLALAGLALMITATATLAIPPNLPPSMVGFSGHHASGILGTGTLIATRNAVPLTITS